MRSDFYGLPWAAQQAIRKGERAQHSARSSGNEVTRLEARIEHLQSEVERKDAALLSIQRQARLNSTGSGLCKLIDETATAALTHQMEKRNG